MKKKLLLMSVILISIFMIFGTSLAWQGRMAGMGDPYGLVGDESDSLIHPAMLVDGQAINFYSHYRYTYTNVMDWDVYWSRTNNWEDFDGSGDEQAHEALLGSTFPLGPGRMGVFFSYDGQRNDYEGDNYVTWATTGTQEWDFQDDSDEFALRIMYGLPLNGFVLGTEMGVAYREEESKNTLDKTDYVSEIYYNDFEWVGNYHNTFPYDFDYWEALLKGSVESAFGPVSAAFTIRGGYVLSGENALEYKYEDPVGTTDWAFDLDGDVEGWSVGGDLWLRYALCDGLTLPFLVRADYKEKTRDGNGKDTAGIWNGFNHYENTEKSLNIEAGGGFDRKCSEALSRLAAGVYYNYIQNKNDFELRWDEYGTSSSWLRGWNGPDITEHRAIFRLVWEKQFSSMFTLRTGANGFYGRMKKKVTSYDGDRDGNRFISKGPHWGMGASLGGTLTFNSFTIEPFINGGYEECDLEGDRATLDDGSIVGYYDDYDFSQERWFVGGGFSILFGN